MNLECPLSAVPGEYESDCGRALKSLSFESNGGGRCERILPVPFDIRDPRRRSGL